MRSGSAGQRNHLRAWFGRERALILVLVVALVLRWLVTVALVVWNPDGLANGDTQGYWKLAVNLVNRGVFSRQDGPPFLPDAFRTPGYPAFLTSFVALKLGWVSVALVQSLLACATIVLLFVLLQKGFGRRIALVASWLVALDPESVLFAATVAPATLVTLLLVASVLLASRGGRPFSCFGAGLLSGLAALVKPMALYFPLWLAGLCLLDKSRSARIWRAFLVLVASVVVLVPWFVRNSRTFGVWRFTSIQGFNLLYYNAAALESAERGLPVSRVQDSLAVQLHSGRADFAELNELQRAREMERLAVRLIFSHPFKYALLHLRGIPTSLLDPGRIDWARVLGFRNPRRGFFDILSVSSTGELWAFVRSLPWLQVLVLVAYGGFLLFVTAFFLAGVWLLAGGGNLEAGIRRFGWLWVMGPLVYLWLIIGPIGGARFRVPMWPFVASVAALGLGRTPWRRLLGKRFPGAVALIASVLILAVRLYAGSPAEKVVFREEFSRGASAWLFRPSSKWEIHLESGNSILCLVRPGKMGKIRAPESWAVRRGVDESNYVFEGRLRCAAPVETTSRDLCVFFNFQDSLHFGYVHFSARSDRVHNIIGLVDGRNRVKINREPAGKSSARLTDKRWHRFRVSVDGVSGSVRAYLDDFDRLALTAVDTVLRHGTVGIGSFDDTGCFDDLVLRCRVKSPGKGRD